VNSQLLALFIFLGILLLLIGISELLYRFFRLPAETSRKFLHVSGGLTCLLLPRFFTSHWWILALTSSAFLLLFITYIMNMLQSVHKTKRNSIGSIIFPIPVYFCFLAADTFHNNLFFYLPVSLLAISDTSAEIAGTRWGHLTKQFFDGQKTLAGTLAFFGTALIICFGWLSYYHLPARSLIVSGLVISITTSLAELVTLKGWDNLTIPVIAGIILWFFIK
jgi:phytol kinase